MSGRITIERRGSKLYLLDENGDPTTTSFGSYDEAGEYMMDSDYWGFVRNKDGRKSRPLTEKRLMKRAKARKPETLSERFWKHSPDRFWKRAERRAKKYKKEMRQL